MRHNILQPKKSCNLRSFADVGHFYYKKRKKRIILYGRLTFMVAKELEGIHHCVHQLQRSY